MSGLGRCPDLRNPDLGGFTVYAYQHQAINIIGYNAEFYTFIYQK